MAKKKSKKSPKIEETYDLQFIFRNINCKIRNVGDLSDKDFNDIKNIIKHFSKEIIIDKSYVDFEGNYHRDSFLIEEGWDELNKVVINSKFGKTAKKWELEAMHEAFNNMICAYMFDIISIFGYDPSDIALKLVPKPRKNVPFDLLFQYDMIEEWKTYNKVYKKLWKLDKEEQEKEEEEKDK